MIDFIKFRIEDKEAFESIIEDNKLIELKNSVNSFTGELSEYPKKGKYHNLQINITEDYAYIEGSIHKFYNNLTGFGNVNYNDFTIKKCMYSINWLCRIFNISQDKTRITNLEFGFNLFTEYNVSQVIKENILLWNFDTHNRRQKYKSKGICKEFGLSDYKIKIYNKGEEAKLNLENLMRIELKITTARVLNRLGIYNISNININALKSLYKEFIKQFDRLLILDSIIPPNRLEIHDAVFFIDYTKFDKWNMNKAIKSNYERGKDKRKLMKMITQNNYNKIQSHLRKLIIEKYYQLSNSNLKTLTL